MAFPEDRLIDTGLARPGQGSAQHAHFNLHASTTVDAGGAIADFDPVPKPTSTDGPAAQKAWEAYVKKLVAHVGPSWVNSKIGAAWGQEIFDFKNRIVAKKGIYPVASYPIWRMNIAVTYSLK